MIIAHSHDSQITQPHPTYVIVMIIEICQIVWLHFRRRLIYKYEDILLNNT